MQELERSLGDISWIDSLRVFFLFFLGTFAGRLTDAGQFRVVIFMDSLLTCLGDFRARIGTT